MITLDSGPTRKRLLPSGVKRLLTVLLTLGLLTGTAGAAQAFSSYRVNVNDPYSPLYARPAAVMANCGSGGIAVGGIFATGLPNRSGYQYIYAVVHIEKWGAGVWQPYTPPGNPNPALKAGGIAVKSGVTASFPGKTFTFSASGYYRVFIEVDWRYNNARINNSYYGPSMLSEYGSSKYKYAGPYCAAGAWAA